MLFLDKLAKPVCIKMVVPGSKSMTNRALLISAFASGKSIISGVLESDDCDACLDVISKLGANVIKKGSTVEIDGFAKNPPVKNADLFINSSGTLARFLPGMLAAVEGGMYTVNGTEQLRKRPLLPLLQSLRAMEADIKGDILPLKIGGKNLKGGKISVSVAKSSQYASGIMMMSPLCAGEVELTVEDAKSDEENYIVMTYQMMRDFGIEINKTAYGFKTDPSSSYKAKKYTVEADFNTALYFLALATVTKSDITVTNIGKNTVQPGFDFLKVLKQIGAEVEAETGYIRVVGTDVLKGGFTIDMRRMSESALTLAAIAPFLDEPITMTNLSHIRGHECDRLKAMSHNLELLGIKCEEFKDGITVFPGEIKENAVLETFDDHRVAMSFALSLLKGKGGFLVNPDCVSKTCPHYFAMLHDLGCSVSYKK